MKCPYCDEKTIFHVHTYRCKHASQEREEEYVKKAISLGSTKRDYEEKSVNKIFYDKNGR